MEKIIVLFLFIRVFTLQCHAQDELSFNELAELYPEWENPDWMRQANEDLLLSEVTIPGAHDATALRGGRFAKCQAWSLEDQLSAGLRYFDLRVDGSLQLVHGPIKMNMKLAEVLDTIVKFLKEHNKETVLLRVKPENRKDTVFDKTMELLKQDNIKPFVYMLDGSSDNNPKLKTVRGKIVLLKLPDKFNFGISYFSTHKKN
ncbi:hypothetical protein ANANG_G00033360, partial [Anguilla anguilla]